MTKVFGAANCTGCVTVKRVLKEKGVEFVEFDVNTLDGMEEAMKYNVRSIPTMVVSSETVSGGLSVFVGEKNCLEGIKQHLEA